MQITIKRDDSSEPETINVNELYIDLAPGRARARAAGEWFIPRGFLYLDYNEPDHACVIGASFKDEPHPDGVVLDFA